MYVICCETSWCEILSQREKDLELAAKIGQTLLQRNKLLEADLITTLDQRQQSEQQVGCHTCLLYTSPSPRDATLSRMPSSA